jgi:hypothetical protein
MDAPGTDDREARLDEAAERLAEIFIAQWEHGRRSARGRDEARRDGPPGANDPTPGPDPPRLAQ